MKAKWLLRYQEYKVLVGATKTNGLIKCDGSDGYIHGARYFNDTLLIVGGANMKTVLRIME